MASDNAVSNANDEFVEAWTFLKETTKLPGSVKCLLGPSFKGAKTDSRNIEFSDSFMQKCISANYHGFPTDHIARIGGTTFVIGHEIGHLTTHPGRGCDWMKERASYPCAPGQKPMWSNVLSDIVVNFHVCRQLNWKGVTNKLHEAKYRKAMSEGRLWDIVNRDCSDLNRHADLLARTKVKDNRYQPAGMQLGDYDGGDPADAKIPTVNTPYFQTVQGHGRGEQFYPPIAWCLANGLKGKWVKVELQEDTLSSFQCKDTGEIYSWPSSPISPITGNKATKIGSVNRGHHEVEKVIHFDGSVNSTVPKIPKYYQIQGKLYPAQYFRGLCPDCEGDACSSWIAATQPRPEGVGQRDHNFLYRMLLTQEFAANAATDGFSGKKGKEAAKEWFKQSAYQLHVAFQQYA